MVHSYARVWFHVFISYHVAYALIEGPNEVSVADVDIIPNILGPDGMTRGPCLFSIPPSDCCYSINPC